MNWKNIRSRLKQHLALFRLEPLDQWNIQYKQKGFDRADYFLKRMQRYFLLSGKKVLDLGCGRGYLSIRTCKIAQEVVAIDVVKQTLKNLKTKLHHQRISNIELVKADATHLPFKSRIFDAVSAYDLYEHVKDQKTLLSEEFRVVKINGCIAFSTGNKLFLKDRHTGLWFIDYLPRKIANIYVKLRKKRGSYDIYEPTYWSLKKTLSQLGPYYLVDGNYVLGMVKEVYPHLFKRFAKLTSLLSLTERIKVFKFFTPKFFVIALKFSNSS